MRVAQIFGANAHQYGGVQNHVYNLSFYLQALGHRIEVFSYRKRSIYPFPRYHQAGSAISLPSPNGNVTCISFPDATTDNAIDLINRKFDVCHLHEPYDPLVNWKILNEVQIPLVVTYHTAWDDGSTAALLNLLSPFYKNILQKKARGIIYVSETARSLWSSADFAGIKNTIIPHGIDHRLFKVSQAQKNSPTRLLFVARLVPKKGLMTLLRALDLIWQKYPRLQLVVVGSGSDYSRAAKFVRDHKLTKKVEFIPHADEAEKARIYKDADIFCAPYKDEAFGITLLEAMASGLPIVGCRNRAFSEVLKNYPQPDLLVDYGDSVGLAKAIGKLLENPSVFNRIRDWEARESKKYDWTQVAEKTLAFYKLVTKKQ